MAESDRTAPSARDGGPSPSDGRGRDQTAADRLFRVPGPALPTGRDGSSSRGAEADRGGQHRSTYHRYCPSDSSATGDAQAQDSGRARDCHRYRVEGDRDLDPGRKVGWRRSASPSSLLTSTPPTAKPVGEPRRWAVPPLRTAEREEKHLFWSGRRASPARVPRIRRWRSGTASRYDRTRRVRYREWPPSANPAAASPPVRGSTTRLLLRYAAGRMRLFDEIHRTDSSPAFPGEDSFTFLNRIESPYWARVRAVLEQWFGKYPAHQQRDLRARLRDALPQLHFAAWWELYLHELFIRLGYAVEVHPPSPSATSKPDFELRRDATSLYLEAVTVFSGIVEEGRHPSHEAHIMRILASIVQ
jgi:hypothetical protein